MEFKNITIDSTGEMLPFYELRHNRTCDSVFLESFLWKEYYHVKYAIWEQKALLWLMKDGDLIYSAMPLCKEEDLPGAFLALEQYFNEELKRPLVIALADEEGLAKLQLSPEQYEISENPDARDYLYDGEAMRTLPGKKLHKKKNRINAFKREYEGRFEYRRLCCADSWAVWKFLDQWRETKGEDAEQHLDYEVSGIHDILKHCAGLHIRMGGVFIDGCLEAFTIASHNILEDMAVIHIEKANPEMNGLYQYINQQFLLEEFPHVRWVNREDDMGLPGLRKAKESYQPADFVRKYLVKQRWTPSEPLTQREKEAAATDEKSAQLTFSFLSEEEKRETVPLWKSCFSEDSEDFIDYYYNEKTGDNRILVRKDGDQILSMVHLNPYRIRFRQNILPADYLVAVSTDGNHRRQGHFRALFSCLLHLKQKEGAPFTYLVPVNPAVYEPLDFVMFGSLPNVKLTEEAERKLVRVNCRDTESDCREAAAYMNHWLESRYEMYTVRDEAYVSRLIRELASENGRLTFLRDEDRLAGLIAVWGLEVREQRLLYAEEEYTIQTGFRPFNMARIVSLAAFMKLFGAADPEKPFRLILEAEDPILEDNNGRFLWEAAEGETKVQRIGEEPASPLPTLHTGMGSLARFLLGAAAPDKIWKGLQTEVLEQLERIDAVHGVFLDEIV